MGLLLPDPDLPQQLGAGILRIQAGPNQRDRAALSGTCHQSGTLALVELRTQACQRFVLEQGGEHIGIGLANYGQFSVEFADRIHGGPARDGLLYALLPGQMVGLQFQSPKAQWLHLTLKQQALQHTCMALGMASPDWNGLGLYLREDANLLVSLAKRFWAEHDQGGSARPMETNRATEQMILLHLASLLTHQRQADGRFIADSQRSSSNSESARPARSRQLVDQAIDYFKHHLDQEIDLNRLCNHCAVSTRRMQTAFQRCDGRTPMQVLQQMRIQQLRRQLLAGISVGEACRRVGLRLSGRIASHYQNQYGELPRQTLASVNPDRPQRES